jgi:hypothetical protein
MDALLSRARRFTRVFVFASFVFATFGYGNELHLRLLGNYQSGIFDGAAAEIADYDPTTQRVFVTNDAMNPSTSSISAIHFIPFNSTLSICRRTAPV